MPSSVPEGERKRNEMLGNIQNRCTILAEREREIARDTERETKRQINMKEIIKILIEDLV